MPPNPQNQDKESQVESVTVNSIKETGIESADDDSRAEQERQQFDRTALQANVEDLVTKHLANVATADTIAARRFFTCSLFWTTYVWLLLVILIVLAAGWKWRGFALSDSVLIALITTTTINVIAIFKGVTEHLFPVPKQTVNSNSKDSKEKAG